MSTSILIHIIYLLSIIFTTSSSEYGGDDDGNGSGDGSGSNGSSSTGDVQPATPCGPYGFRCIDQRSFQLCAFRDISGQTERPDTVHECQDHNVCDEESQSYCSSPGIGNWMMPSKVGSYTSDAVDRKKRRTRYSRKSKSKPNTLTMILQNKEQQESSSEGLIMPPMKPKQSYRCSKFGFFEGNIFFTIMFHNMP